MITNHLGTGNQPLCEKDRVVWSTGPLSLRLCLTQWRSRRLANEAMQWEKETTILLEEAGHTTCRQELPLFQLHSLCKTLSKSPKSIFLLVTPDGPVPTLCKSKTSRVNLQERWDSQLRSTFLGLLSIRWTATSCQVFWHENKINTYIHKNKENKTIPKYLFEATEIEGVSIIWALFALCLHSSAMKMKTVPAPEMLQE